MLVEILECVLVGHPVVEGRIHTIATGNTWSKSICWYTFDVSESLIWVDCMYFYALVIYYSIFEYFFLLFQPKYIQRLKAIKATLEVSDFFTSHEVSCNK
jgi:hypothetical protein